MANRRAGAKTGANLGRKKADLSLPPKTAKPKTPTARPTARPTATTPATPTPSNMPKSATPTPSNRPKKPERPPTVVDETEYYKLRNASRIKDAMRDNPLPKIGNDLVKMNKGGKIRGYGMARGGKVCKMR